MFGHPLSFMRLPYGLLEAIDSRHLHFWMQPTHFIVRLLHILSMSAFFGTVLVLDLRLLSRTATVTLRPLTELVLPWLHKSFFVAMLTGVALFLYDPVGVGARGYFSPKLLLIVIAMLVGAVGHRKSYRPVLLGTAPIPLGMRISAALSLTLWSAVIICSSLNSEGVPKVFLR